LLKNLGLRLLRRLSEEFSKNIVQAKKEPNKRKYCKNINQEMKGI
jgi:hypothetical protein